ncbi:recombinase family protein [Leucobacter sp. HY1910]
MGTQKGQLVLREYLRVSKDKSGEGKSPKQQHKENARAAQSQGWKLHPHPYEDNDRSASLYATKQREQFNQLITDLEEGKFDADILGLWEASRGSRRVGEWLDLIDLCSKNRVKIWVTTHSQLYDPANARHRRSLLEDAVDSEFESAKIRERIKRDVRAAAEEGRPHGKNLYGYRRIYDETTRRLLRIEEHPDQAWVVQEAAERILGGASFYSVAKDFNERGIPPRRPRHEKREHHYKKPTMGWTAPAIKQMLTMPAYAAKRIHNGEIVSDAIWPALIDYEVWQKLQNVMSPSHRKRTNNWPGRHLLAGIAVCGVCGAGTRVGKQNSGRRKDKDGNPVPKPQDEHGNELPYPSYSTYLCAGAPGRTGFHVAQKEEHLDLIVTEFVLARLERKDFLATLGKKDEGVDDARQALLQEIEQHQNYLEEVRAKAAERGRIDLLFDQEERIQPLISAAQKKLEALADTDPAVIELTNNPDAVRARWEELDFNDKRRIIRAVVTPVIHRVKNKSGKGSGQRHGPDWNRVEMVWR